MWPKTRGGAVFGAPNATTAIPMVHQCSLSLADAFADYGSGEGIELRHRYWWVESFHCIKAGIYQKEGFRDGRFVFFGVNRHAFAPPQQVFEIKGEEEKYTRPIEVG